MGSVLLYDAVQGSYSLVVIDSDGANLAGDGFEHAVGNRLDSQTIRLAVGLHEAEVWAEGAGERFGARCGTADGSQVERDGEGDESAKVVASGGVEGVGSGVEGGQVGGRQADRDAAGGGL